MLRLLTDQLRIYLHPASVVVVHERRGLKRQIVSTVVRHIESQQETQRWSDAIALLQSMIAQDQYRALPAKVVLSSHWLKYRVVPWHAQLSEAERASLVQHQFAEVYGAQAAGLDFAISNTSFKQHELACAFDAEMIAALRLTLKQRQIRLLSIQPVMVAALNRFRKQLKLPAWVVIRENGITTLAGLSADGWESVRTQAAEQIELSDVALWLERESLHVGSKMADAAIYQYGFETDSAQGVVLGKQLHKLALAELVEFSAASHPEARLALVA